MSRSDKEKVRVTEAIIEKKDSDKNYVPDNEDEKTKRMLWMHKKQQKQLLSWENEDDDTVGRFGLRIIVLQNMFSLEESSKPGFKEELMEDVRIGCEEFGTIDKITIFDKNPDGIVLVRFRSAAAAQNCIRRMNGRYFAGRQLKAISGMATQITRCE